MATYESTLLSDRADAAPWSLLAVVTAATVLALPALWNGYPLAYYDSVDYVLMPFTWDMPVYRTAAYGVFALTGRLAHSLWGIVLVQSLIAAYVLYETFRLWAPAAPRRALVACTIILSTVTGLPWFTSQLMPDAFTGAILLAVLLLAFHGGTLSRWREGALVAILAVGTASHTTHFALVGGLILCLAATGWLARRGWPVLLPRLRLTVIGLLVALGLAIGSNWLMTGRAFLTQPSAVLTLGLLVQDGLAKRYLDEVCAMPGAEKPRLCVVRNRLPDTANEFLWHDQDFWRLGWWTGMQSEARRIVQGCLRKYPFTYAWISLKLMFQQLAMVETGDGLTPMKFFVGHAIRDHYPREMAAFANAEQQAGIDFTLINDIQVPVQLVSFFALFAVLWFAWRQRDRVSVTLSALVLLAFFGNAFVCGALSNPNDRYQSRIAWVGVLVVMLTSVRLVERRDWLTSQVRPRTEAREDRA
jgi:hypothetical protein